MIAFGHEIAPLIFSATIFILTSLCTVDAVSPNQLDKLTREQLLQLDREVSQFYVDSYEKLSLRAGNQSTPTITYDEQLYKSIKALRHTTVTNHFDFRYTSNETQWQSMGASVNKQRCKHQLRILVQLARKMLQANQRNEETPLSVVDFFEASGKTGSGILNGNFVWLGSYASCERAKISARVQSQDATLSEEASQLQIEQVNSTSSSEEELDIKGRYCVAHLRAKTWPKWDAHFENRITIRRGICLPDSCHSALYDGDGDDDKDDSGAEIRLLVDYLAQFNLLPPFGDAERYETQTIYCLPDEDSPYRRLDLGAKLFMLFAALWLLLTFYTNVKYHRRMRALRELRDTVDITMIINDKTSGRDDEPKEEVNAESKGLPEAGSSMEFLEAQFLSSNQLFAAKKSDGSAQSSACNTPLPSDLEDADSDPNHLIEPFKTRQKRKRNNKRKANVNYAYQAGGEQVASGGEDDKNSSGSEFSDLIRDFSIESNLAWLIRPREELLKHSRSKQTHSSSSSLRNHRGSNVVIQQHSASPAVLRRASNSNEALVKELHEGQPKVSAASKVSVSSSSDEHVPGGAGRAEDAGSGKVKGQGEDKAGHHVTGRVNIDILDGLKVIATMWIVFGHTFMFFFAVVEDLRFGVERMFDVTITATINTLQVVGLFYVTTGCLLTYISFSKAKRKQLLNPLFWLLVVIGRYIRLMPPYLLVFWFARHVAPHTGYGRDWLDYRTDNEHPRGFCGQESWWVPLTMSAADIKIPMDCIPQAWYLSDDFRTLLVLPAYVFLLAKSARLGYAAIFATVVYSNCRLAAILTAANIDYQIMLLWQPHVYALMVDRLHDVYTDFFVRMSTYLLGVVVGHLLYLYEIRAIKQFPGWLSMRVALLSAAGFFFGAPMLSSPHISQFLPAREALNSDLIVWLIPLFKTSMELSLAITILLLLTGGGFRWARAFLSSQAMKTLSNISYAVFLLHVEIMYKLPGTRFESNYWQLVMYSIFLITISHVVAFFVYLLYEMPLNNLSRRLLKRAAKLVS